MERPYVACHMLSSLDGRISGAFMENPVSKAAGMVYGRVSETFGCHATLYGTTTMAESFACGYVDEVLRALRQYAKTDYKAQSDVRDYIVSVDPAGQLAWKEKYIENYE